MSRVARVWAAAVVALTVVLAAIPLLLFDAGANDGAAAFTALFGLPMLATAALIGIAAPRGRGEGGVVRRLLPWVGAMAAGLIVLAIPATLLDPVYYESQTQAGMFAVLAAFLFILAFGVVSGVVVWALVVLPVAALADAVARSWRGEQVASPRFAIPAIVLAVELVVVIAIIVFGEVDVDDLAIVQIPVALVSVPAPWFVSFEPILWVVRVALVAIILVAVVFTLLWHRPASNDDIHSSPTDRGAR